MEQAVPKFKNREKSAANKNIKFKTLKQLLRTISTSEPKYFSTYNMVSLRRKKKLCDLTGLPANYTCPRTGLHFYDLSVYDEISEMRHEAIDRIKSIRNYGAELNVFKNKY